MDFIWVSDLAIYVSCSWLPEMLCSNYYIAFFFHQVFHKIRTIILNVHFSNYELRIVPKSLCVFGINFDLALRHQWRFFPNIIECFFVSPIFIQILFLYLDIAICYICYLVFHWSPNDSVWYHTWIISCLFCFKGDDSSILSTSAVSLDKICEVYIKFLVNFWFEYCNVEKCVLCVFLVSFSLQVNGYLSTVLWNVDLVLRVF